MTNRLVLVYISRGKMMKTKGAFSRLKEQERKTRKAIIIDAAERVFASKPFSKVTMRDIAGEAGISPGAIYRYFPDQQTLFVEAFLIGAEGIAKSVQEILSKDGYTIDKVAESFINYLFENDHYFKMMTHFILEGSIKDSLLDRTNAVARYMLEQFDTMFKKMGATGDVRPLSHAFFAALNGILITFYNYPGRGRQEILKHMQVLARIIASLFKNRLSL